MKKILFFLFLGISLNIFAQETKEPKAISLDELKSIIGQNDDKLYVINFWATWCKPCIDELPGFMAVHEQYKDNPNFKMILVSLDHKRQLNTKVKRFIDKNNIELKFYCWMNPDMQANGCLKLKKIGWVQFLQLFYIKIMRNYFSDNFK